MKRLKRDYLTPDGIIIIRDGYYDTNEKIVKFKMVNPVETKLFFEAYKSYKWERPEFDGEYLIGSLSSVKEFLNKYTWGWNSLPREINEKVGFFSIEDYVELSKILDTDISIHPILQVNYFTYLKKIVKIEKSQRWDTHYIVTISQRVDLSILFFI